MTRTTSFQDRYAATMMPNYGVPPLMLARGEGCVVWDADDNSYLDLVGGIAVSALGHAHPALVAAVTAQVGKLAHCSNLYAHEGQIVLAERLLELVGGDGRVFFANSGTEANEAAVKLVRRAQGAAAGLRRGRARLPRPVHGLAQPDGQRVDPRAIHAVWG